MQATLKGFACKFVCKSTYASCMNGALISISQSRRIPNHTKFSIPNCTEAQVQFFASMVRAASSKQKSEQSSLWFQLSDNSCPLSAQETMKNLSWEKQWVYSVLRIKQHSDQTLRSSYSHLSIPGNNGLFVTVFSQYHNQIWTQFLLQFMSLVEVRPPYLLCSLNVWAVTSKNGIKKPCAGHRVCHVHI